MKRNRFIVKATLAVALAIFSSTAAMGQETVKGDSAKTSILDKKWVKELTSRIQLHGYAQGGYNYTHQNGTNTNTFELKRVLFWADAQITDRWSFLFMHDFSSVVQEFYTDFRISKDNALTVRLGQFKHSYSMEKD